MGKRLTTKEFIRRAREVHGDKYDYSKTSYVNSNKKVCIICKEHGGFWQRAADHMKGCGCPKCSIDNQKKILYGFGINDLKDITKDKAYNRWSLLIRRCYCDSILAKLPTYQTCYVCEEWRLLSNFKKWFDEYYVEGWQLDKDILIKGNKEYAPDKCCFVPQEINKLFTKRQRCRGALPIGVSLGVGTHKPYRVYIQDGEKQHYLGFFDNVIDAFNAYKEAKEKRIKELADKYRDKLEPRVYEALYNYKVEITD